MKWKLAVNANWIRDSSSGSMADRLSHSGSIRGRHSLDEVERQRRGPAEPVGAEALAAERVEVLAEARARDEAEAAQEDRVGLRGLAVLASPFQSSQFVLIQTGPRQ